MLLGIASDHAGYSLKEALKEALQRNGTRIKDYGTTSADSTDYPDYANALVVGIQEKEIEKGILICGSGIGMSIAANRYPFIRAALAITPQMASLSRAHNDANILVLGSRFVSEMLAKEIVDCFLKTPFEGGRHEARVRKLSEKKGDDL